MADPANPPAFRVTLPVAGRLKLKFASFDALVNRLARHISQDGVFIPTESPKHAGTLLALEISLQDGQVILEAEGEILWNRKTTTPQQPSGMAFRFINLSEASRQFVWKVAHMNREAGIPPAVVSESFVATPSVEHATLEMPGSAPAASGGEGVILGIDFGTCNSCVAYVKNEKAELVPADRGGLIIPSVVALNEKGNIIFGQHAKEQLLTNPKNTIFGIKRFLGRNFRSPAVRYMAPKFPYALRENEQNEILVTLGDRDYTLPDIVAMLLSHLRENAEGHLQVPVKKAIITVPAYFTENQRAATKHAAKLAGLNVDLVFNEPTAAALAYGYNKDYEKRVLVFDLGGGTFDVSILEVSGNVFEVKGSGGEPFLGGLDFDQRLVDFIAASFEKQNKVELRDNLVALQRITNAAENAKILLSFQQEADINLPYLVQKKGQPVDLKMKLTRQQLNDLTKDLVEKTLQICENTIHAMGLMPSDIEEVLLVGGQTRMPFLRERVAQYFGREPSKGAHPDEAVALGAALLGSSLQMIDGPMLLDVLALPIGRGLPSGKVQPIFTKGSQLPSRKSYPLTALLGEHPEATLPLYQGDKATVGENEYLGDIALVAKTLHAEAAQINVNFELTREGILNVQAHHEATGKVEKLALQLREGKGAPLPAEIAKGAARKEPSRGLFGKLFNKG